MKYIILTLCLIFQSSLSYGQNNYCHLFLSTIDENDSAAVTENFISYLSILLNERILTFKDLKNFVKNLEEKGIFVNPLLEYRDILIDRKTHSENLQPYIDNAKQLDKNSILQWANELIAKEKMVREKKTQTREKTVSPFTQMKFLVVDFSELKNSGKVSHSIEMMQTLVTQHMWMEVMGTNPARFRKGGDYPIESVSLWSAMAFANKISEKHNLKPVYNLEGLVWKGKAEDGDLDLDREHYRTWVHLEDALKKIGVPTEYNPFDITQSEGYRLPTIIEKQILYSYFFKQINEPIHHVAWIDDKITHEVGIDPLGRPTKFDDFADKIGNVSEWTSTVRVDGADAGTGIKYLIAGKVLGASWQSDKEAIKDPPLIHDIYAFAKNSTTGLRLVRTIVKAKSGQP